VAAQKPLSKRAPNWPESPLFIGAIYLTYALAITFGNFTFATIPISTSASDSPLAARVDALCSLYLYTSDNGPRLYNVIVHFSVAGLLSAIFLLMKGDPCGTIGFVLLVLLDAGFMSPLLSSASFSLHVFLNLGAFALFYKILRQNPLTKDWYIFGAGGAAVVAADLALRSEGLLLLGVFAFAVAFPRRNSDPDIRTSIWFCLGVAATGIAIVVGISHAIVGLPAFNLFLFFQVTIQDFIDDYHSMQWGWTLWIVMFFALPLRSSVPAFKSRRNMALLLKIAAIGTIVLPWSTGHDAIILRLTQLRFLCIVLAGMVIVKQKNYRVVTYGILLAALVFAWVARYRFRTIDFDI
jgi:hypothetical protein